MVTPELRMEGAVCVEFYYHMYGQDMRSLLLLQRMGDNAVSLDDIIWTQTGNQGNQWKQYRATHHFTTKRERVGLQYYHS